MPSVGQLGADKDNFQPESKDSCSWVKTSQSNVRDLSESVRRSRPASRDSASAGRAFQSLARVSSSPCRDSITKKGSQPPSKANVGSHSVVYGDKVISPSAGVVVSPSIDPNSIVSKTKVSVMTQTSNLLKPFLSL